MNISYVLSNGRAAKQIVMLALLVVTALSFAETDKRDRLGGRLRAVVDGQELLFPVLKTDIDAAIAGDLATVTVTQTFANPLSTPLHAKYLFPLNKGAAVHSMVMEVGDERVRAIIQEKQKAEQTFARAKSEGRSAALLKQHRPNMFTQSIANLMPGLPVKIELKYVQTVPKIDGDYELVMPLVVGPRFQPPGVAEPFTDQAGVDDEAPAPEQRFGTWELQALPEYPPVHGLDIPDTVDAERVSIRLSIDGGMPIQHVRSDTHMLDVQADSERVWDVRLAAGRIIDNRDFVMRYALAGSSAQAGLLSSFDNEKGGFFSLLIEPPAMPRPDEIMPREMVFVLDCSGSMSGLPMQASKAFMRQALRKLRPTDQFRIIRFSDSATEFSVRPLPANQVNVQRGLMYTEQLYGSGGTMMSSGVQQALGVPADPNVMRMVVFLTDGYIGNELDILRLLNEKMGAARLFAFGVGTSVNRYLLDEMGRVGRGFTRYMDPTEQVGEVAAELASRLDAPLLTDIEIDWGELAPSDIYPSRIPDLFAGHAVRVQGRYKEPGRHTLMVRGKVNGRPAEMPLQAELADNEGSGKAVPLVWARSAIGDAMFGLTVPQHVRHNHPAYFGLSDEVLKQRVTELGLSWSLVTQWTAFVAVSEKIFNPDPTLAPDSQVPLPMVKGVSAKAYPKAAPIFVGAGAPEPGTWLAMAMMAVLLLGFQWLIRYRTKRAYWCHS